jgi:exopolyphosphatase/guanosine-5'-triphosphate,3'-diphosphate pyrophosphatase
VSDRRVAAIDIGTNSVLLLVASGSTDKLVPLLERATITRLGEGVDRTRRLDPRAVERTLACLSEYASELRAQQVDALEVVGTSAMRDAEGGSEFVAAAEALLGVRPRTIDGLEEARLTFAGSLSGLGLQGAVSVFDVGGGSTEIIHGDARATDSPASAVSLDIGSVRLFERHVRSDPATRDELRLVATDIRRALASAPPGDPQSALVGVAGTVTTLAAIELRLDDYDPARVHGHSMSFESVSAIADRLAAMDLSARRALAGLEPKRADVIVVGAEIVRQVMLWAQKSSVRVSDRGVRWGLAERLVRSSSGI